MRKQSVTMLILGLVIAGHLPTSPAHAKEGMISTDFDSTLTLFRFDAPDSLNRWVAINDDVMGGVSHGAMAITRDSCLQFEGSLSLENGGGFASIRTPLLKPDLTGYTGIRIRVKGDGRTYQFRLRPDTGMDGIAYRRDFQTVPDTWVEIDLPFESFQPSYRGDIIKDAEPLRAAEIRQLGFLIADKTAGAFRLIIGAIGAYK